jgi:hypothetical protein
MAIIFYNCCNLNYFRSIFLKICKNRSGRFYGEIEKGL